MGLTGYVTNISYLDPHILRDTFAGAQFALSELQPDGMTYKAVNLTGCTVLIQFRKSHNTSVVMDLKIYY